MAPLRTGLFVLTLLLGRAGASPPPDAACAVRTAACVPPPYVAIMSAFPAEVAPLLAAARVSETIPLGDRTAHVGTLAGVPVVLVRGGIGLVNAAATANALVDRFELSAIVFSGVAGSQLDIGDVAVPAAWSDGTASFPVAASLLAIAATLTSPPVALERCTSTPNACVAQAPRIVVGGSGESADPFGGHAQQCRPGGGPVFGCDDALPAALVAAAAVSVDATDMETAAVARVAHDAGIPFIAFRGASDRGNFADFFVYYRIAADNAAAVTIAFLEAWKPSRVADPAPLAAEVAPACDWERTGGPACATADAPRAVDRRVGLACNLLAQGDAATAGSAAARRDATRARRAWRSAARTLRAAHRVPAACRRPLAAALAARARPEPR